MPKSIDQCLMSFTKSVKQHRFTDKTTKRKKKYLMNESNLFTFVSKKRIKFVDKNSINYLINDKKADNNQIDHKYYKLKKKIYNRSKILNSIFLNNISNYKPINGTVQSDTWSKNQTLLNNNSGLKQKTKGFMNSTEMDLKQSFKVQKNLHESTCSGYASNGSSDVEFPTCIKSQSNDCSCEKCWENVFKNESWNESNLLSSTRMIESTEPYLFEKYSNNLKNYKKTQRDIKPVFKKSKSLKRIIKLKENVRPKTSKILTGNAFCSNDEKNFQNYTSMVPINSNENFTKLGDFLVWYI